MKNKWDIDCLNNLCITITDGAHNSPGTVENGFPMASVKDLTPFGININSCRFISEIDFSKLIKQGCQPKIGDILLSKDGATAIDTVCEIKNDYNVVLLSSIAIIRPDNKKLNSSFLKILF